LFAAGERHGLEDAFVADLGLLVRPLAAHLFSAGFLHVVLQWTTFCHISPTQIVEFHRAPLPPRKSKSIQIRLRQLNGAASVGRRAYATRLIRERYVVDAGSLPGGSARNGIVDHNSAGPTRCGRCDGYS